jgi:oligopeptide transport system substrate-binding protein
VSSELRASGATRAFIAALAASVLYCASAAAVAAPPAGTELAVEQVLRRGNGAEAQTLDPHKAEGVPSSHVMRDLFEGLTSEAPNGDIVPGVAESWVLSEDGTVYTFRLRRDAKWSNGDPVTAHDFVFGLRRSVAPDTGSKYSQILAPILNAEAVISGAKPPEALGVRALDDHTLEITLNAPTPYLLGLLNHSSTYPLHAASVREHGERFSRPGNLVSNGAYKLKDWVVQSNIEVERNPHYWNNANTTIDRVIFYPIEDQSTELKRYRAGELDWTDELPNNQFGWIRENLGDALVISPWIGTYYYGFNLTRPPFKDNPKLRRALSMAIDREILTGKVTQFGEIPAYGWVPPGISHYESCTLDYGGWPREKRLAEARRLYQEAGYSKANPLVTEIRYNTQENHKKIAIAVAAMWKQNLGVRASLLNEEWKVFLENRKQKQVTQVFRAGWIGDYNDPYTFAELMLSNHGLNDPGYRNPEYDALLEQAARTVDKAQRMKLLHEAECMMLDDHPTAPIYFYVTKRMIRPTLGGYESNIMDHHYSKNFYMLAR